MDLKPEEYRGYKISFIKKESMVIAFGNNEKYSFSCEPRKTKEKALLLAKKQIDHLIKIMQPRHKNPWQPGGYFAGRSSGMFGR